jgi:hypothetical protein
MQAATLCRKGTEVLGQLLGLAKHSRTDGIWLLRAGRMTVIQYDTGYRQLDGSHQVIDIRLRLAKQGPGRNLVSDLTPFAEWRQSCLVRLF